MSIFEKIISNPNPEKGKEDFEVLMDTFFGLCPDELAEMLPGGSNEEEAENMILLIPVRLWNWLAVNMVEEFIFDTSIEVLTFREIPLYPCVREEITLANKLKVSETEGSYSASKLVLALEMSEVFKLGEVNEVIRRG